MTEEFCPTLIIHVRAEVFATVMTRLLEEVVADVRDLPAEEQDRAAETLLIFLGGWEDQFG